MVRHDKVAHRYARAAFDYVGSGAKARYDSVAKNERVLGDPARPHMLMKRIEGTLPKLPDMRRRLRTLERRVAKLDGQGTKSDERE